MCGLCGVVSFGSPGAAAPDAQREREAEVEAMMAALAHRGPDDAALHGDDRAAIGATRLSIRGIHSGRQPLVHAASGVTCACNGEIDNHRELRAWLLSRGHAIDQETDVAVIPGLYLELGDAFVERLVGAYAIAIWDPRNGALLLARDRAGERPVFYRREQDGVRFATELAPLAPEASAASLDVAALRGYLARGCFVAPETPVREIRKVPPGHVVTFTRDAVSMRRYWRWTPRATQPPPTVDDLDAALRRAVARQADADVEPGVFLSGGVDSSMVAAMLRRVAPERPLRAYVVRFGESSFDEGSAAARVARHLGLALTEVTASPDDFPSAVSALVGLVGEPLADPAWVPTTLLARRASQDIRLALVGEGADELFGGYPTYPGAALARAYSRLPAPLRAIVGRLVSALPPSDKKVTLSFLLKKFVAGQDLTGLQRHAAWTATIPSDVLRRLGVEPPPPPDAASRENLLDELQRHDLETTLAEGLLTKSDRGSMSWALELRAPFLDVEVMELAARIPGSGRVRGLTTKVMLKQLAERYLPRDIVHRRKRGLSVPLGAWMRGPLGDWCAQRLASPRLAELGVRAPAALELLREHRARQADHARAIWAVSVASEWLDWLAQRAPTPARAQGTASDGDAARAGAHAAGA